MNLKLNIAILVMGSLSIAQQASCMQSPGQPAKRAPISRFAGTLQDHFRRAGYVPNRLEHINTQGVKDMNTQIPTTPTKKKVHFPESTDQLATWHRYNPENKKDVRCVKQDGYASDANIPLRQKNQNTGTFDTSVLQPQPLETKNAANQISDVIINPIVKEDQTVATAQTHWQRISGMWQKCPTLVKAGAVIGAAAAATWTGYQLYKKFIRK